MRRVGDEVKIIDCITSDLYDYVPELEAYKGQNAKITEVLENEDGLRYYLDVDNEAWTWYEEYFQKNLNC